MLWMLYSENRKAVKIMLKCFRNNGTMGIPLEIIFADGAYHLFAMKPWSGYLDSDVQSQTIQEAIFIFKGRTFPEENLNWDTVKYVGSIQKKR